MEKYLIESVRLRRVLYDTKDPNYNRSKLKKRIWDEVANENKMVNGMLQKIYIYHFLSNYQDNNFFYKIIIFKDSI